MDQADSLRELMRKVRPRPEDFGRRVILVQPVAPVLGKSAFVLALALGLSRASQRVLILDEDGSIAPWATPVLSESLEQGRRPPEALVRLSDGIYVLPMAGVRSQSPDSRDLLEAVLESYHWNPDLVLVVQAGFIPTRFPRLLLTDGSRDHLERMRAEFMTANLRQAAVACVGAMDARAARIAFDEFERAGIAFGGQELFYAGFLDLREKSLLHLNSESVSEWESGPHPTDRVLPDPVASVSSWISKRVLEWLVGETNLGDSDFQRSLGYRRIPIVQRFMEESGENPIREGEMSPGNWEGFWKALLSEGNA